MRNKSYYKDPNRRSNWFKGEMVPTRKLGSARRSRYKEVLESGYSDYHSLVKALEIVPKSR